jgi:hypothetical protein
VTTLTPLSSNTVLVEDDGNAKFLVFAGDSLVQTTGYANRMDVLLLSVLGVADSGRLLLSTDGFPINFTEPWLSGWMVRTDLNTLQLDTVASYDMAAFLADWSSWTPFHPQGVIAASGGVFVHARVDLPVLYWRSEDGALLQVLRWVARDQPQEEQNPQARRAALTEELRRLNPTLSPEDLDRLVDQQLERGRNSPRTALPLFGLIHGDREGGVWMAAFEPMAPGPSSRYHVVSPNGLWLGSIQLPPRVRILDIAGRRVLAAVSDELGVESVAVFELELTPLAS